MQFLFIFFYKKFFKYIYFIIIHIYYLKNYLFKFINLIYLPNSLALAAVAEPAPFGLTPHYTGTAQPQLAITCL